MFYAFCCSRAWGLSKQTLTLTATPRPWPCCLSTSFHLLKFRPPSRRCWPVRLPSKTLFLKPFWYAHLTYQSPHVNLPCAWYSCCLIHRNLRLTSQPFAAGPATRQLVMSRRIVVSTAANSYHMDLQGQQAFTHVFVDDASQVRPASSLATPQSHPLRCVFKGVAPKVLFINTARMTSFSLSIHR